LLQHLPAVYLPVFHIPRFFWDNQQGFFRSQGMSNFIGRDGFRAPIFIDPTWGVSDEEMFNRALGQFFVRTVDSP